MRKIFSSQRLENVEAVAQLLEAEGIEVRIERGRGLHRAIRGNFSYRNDGTSNPPPSEVWVIRSDDQPRARALMREVGLLQDTTRPDLPHFAPPTAHAAAIADPGKKRLSRLRYGLLAVVLIVVAVNFIRRPADTPLAATPAPAAATLAMLDDASISAEDRYVIATPPQLALMLARRVLDTEAADAVCLTIDGQDPANTLLDATSGIAAASTCPSTRAVMVDVHQYTTDGSGTGTVRVTRRNGAQVVAQMEELSVRRNGEVWTVLPDDDRPAQP